MQVVARVAHAEAEITSMLLQPCERRGALETFFRGRLASSTDIERATGVVFAVAGRGVDSQDVLDGLAAGELAREDAELIGVAAEAGDRFECDAGSACGGAHALPGAGGIALQPQRPAIAVAASVVQRARFCDQGQCVTLAVAGIDLQLA